MPRKEVLYRIRKHFDCSSEVSFEECVFCFKGSSLWSKVVFVVICAGGKGLSDFCKSSSTTVEESDFYVKESMFMLVLCSVLMVLGCSGGMPKDNMDSVAVSDLIMAEVEQVETTVTEEQSGDSSNVEASNTEEPTVDTTTTEADTEPSTTEAQSELETVTTLLV